MSETRGPARSPRRWRWLGAATLAVPLAIITLFAIGEGIGSEEGWWGHLIQLGLGMVLLAAAWAWPRIGGPLLIAIGLVFGAQWLGQGERDGWAGLVIIMAPLVISGIFFSLAGFGRQRGTAT